MIRARQRREVARVELADHLDARVRRHGSLLMGGMKEARAGAWHPLPGFYLAGQWRAGWALGECITRGQATAARVIAER